MTYTCDRCRQQDRGRRVVFTTEATDPSGADVAVAKRWVTCPACAEDLFAQLAMPSPFTDGDERVVRFPDEGLVAGYAGGYAGALSR